MDFRSYQARLDVLNEARKMFPEERNITHALQKYKDITGSDIELMLDTKDISEPMTFVDEYERPSCPDCGSDMGFKILRENPEGYKVAITCKKCDTQFYSKDSLGDILKTLKVKDVKLRKNVKRK